MDEVRRESGYPCGHERQDEFGELAENFNIMTKRISSYMEERVRREKELNETQIA